LVQTSSEGSSGGVAGNSAGQREGIEDFIRNDGTGDLVCPVGAFVQPVECGLDAFEVALDRIEVDARCGRGRRFGVGLDGGIVGTGISKFAHGHEASRDGGRTRRPIGSGVMAFPPFDGSAPKQQDFPAAPEMGIDASKRYTAKINTTLGEVVVALDAVKAPKTVNNFVFLALNHYYDGVIFHRIINGFMCQGGDPTGTGRGGPGYKFADELPKPREYQVGSLAMANSGPNTNGSQFFIVSGASGVGLPPQYSLFGQVVKGLDIVDTMQNVKTDRSDRPQEDVIIQSVEITVAED
jgi:peptidylprolyl isomerase